NVPLWILVNHVTMGNKVKMYRCITSEVQSKISIEYPGLSEDSLEKVMRYITKFRNVCAHGNRLYNHKTRANMPDTIIHEKLEIYIEGEQFVCGKRDLFGVVIACRYLLSKSDFRKFKMELNRAINSYLNSTSFLNEIEILNEMGFPENWKKISKFHNY
ncbi:MAG: Abi family protein, partial [Longicatena sp.]